MNETQAKNGKTKTKNHSDKVGLCFSIDLPNSSKHPKAMQVDFLEGDNQLLQQVLKNLWGKYLENKRLNYNK